MTKLQESANKWNIDQCQENQRDSTEAKLTLKEINIEQMDCYISEVLSQKLVVWKRMSRDIYYYYYYYYHHRHRHCLLYAG